MLFILCSRHICLLQWQFLLIEEFSYLHFGQQPVEELPRLRVPTSWYLHNFILPLLWTQNLTLLCFWAKAEVVSIIVTVLIGLNRVRGGIRWAFYCFQLETCPPFSASTCTRTSQLLTKMADMKTNLDVTLVWSVFTLNLRGKTPL